MRHLIATLLILSISLALIGCGSANKYMIRDTDEYNTITKKVSGQWGFTKWLKQGNNQLDNPFEKAIVNFDFDAAKATWTFFCSQSYVSGKLADWKQKFATIKVDEYKVIITSKWEVSDEGEVIKISGETGNIAINGSGDNFNDFMALERSKFEASKSAGSGGGLMGMAVGAMTQAATGTSDLFFKLEAFYSFNFSDGDRGLTLNRQAWGVYKQGSQNFDEQMWLKKTK
jgi:hypothetical protein